MKIIFPLLAFYFFPFNTIVSQDVNIFLTGKEFQTPVELNVIFLENLTHPSQVMLSNLPTGITTYRINLSKGMVLGTGDELLHEPYGVFTLSNVPGLLKLLLRLPYDDYMNIDFFNINGRKLHEERLWFRRGGTRIEITGRANGMIILKISGKSLKFNAKFLGDGTGENVEIVSFPGNSLLKSGEASISDPVSLLPEFIYTPGDTIRFSVFKVGHYTSTIVCIPEHDDSCTLYLSIPCPAVPVVNDFDGNMYNTVQIGDQCWMRENLNSTHYADGTPLVDGTGVGPIFGDYTTPYWFNYDDSVYNSITYGKLYTWAAVVHGTSGSKPSSGCVQGICPVGWHVPGDGEWIQLERFLGMSLFQANLVGEWRGTNEGGKLKENGTVNWHFPNTGATNESGFTALPGGLRNNQGLYMSKNYSAYWWTSTEYPGTTSAADRWIVHEMSKIWRNYGSKNFARSVRCLKDF